MSPFQARPNDWLAGLIRQNEQRLVRYAASLVKDSERARDVVQDAVYQLLRQKDGVPPKAAMSWLYRACRHRAIDLLRKEDRMRSIDREWVEKEASPRPGPSRAAERKEAHQDLQRLLGGLPPKQREVLRLRFQGGLSYREISEVSGHSVSHVGVLLHEALRDLRGRLKQEAAR